MNKRGQVSTFFILGIVLVIIVALIFFVRKQSGIGIPAADFLGSKLNTIENDVKRCIDKQGDNLAKEFLEQGGEFYPSDYLLYKGRKVKYYCKNIPKDEKCLNYMQPLNEIEDNFNTRLRTEIENCLNKDLVKKDAFGGYEVTTGSLSTSVDSTGDGLLVSVNYDVTITKGETRTKLGKVNRVISVPMKELYDVSFDIVNSEAQYGFFEQLFYMLNKKGMYIINIDKPFPHKVYKVNKKGSKHELWFAVEGEPS